MKSFKSVDKVTTGEQIRFVVENDVSRPHLTPLRSFEDLRPLVKIDGVPYKTLGVESYATANCGKGVPIRITVEDIKSPHRLGERSREELEGVHPDMIDVVERAIVLTQQDFSVHDGIRTPREQTVYVARGVSQTMKSKHLPQEDGYGHAVDLVPYINGKLRWEWGAIYPIALAVRQASEELDVQVRWGGCWRVITDTKSDPEILVAEYTQRRHRLGRKAFLDGPHFELYNFKD